MLNVPYGKAQSLCRVTSIARDTIQLCLRMGVLCWSSLCVQAMELSGLGLRTRMVGDEVELEWRTADETNNKVCTLLESHGLYAYRVERDV